MLDTLSPVPEQMGLSDIIWNLGTNLKSFGDEVHIIGPYESKDYPDKDIYVHEYKLFSSLYWKISSLWWDWLIKIWVMSPYKAIRVFKKLKKKHNIDIVHVQDAVSAFLLSILERETPIVYTPANCYFHTIQSNSYTWNWGVMQAYKVINIISARLTRHIIATSHIMVNCWKNCGAHSSKITYIPYGVNLKLFRPVSNAKVCIGINPKSKIILYVGRFSREKGIKYLLEAMLNLKESIKDIQLHIIGEGPEKANLIEYVKKLKIEDIVTFHGWAPIQSLVLFYSAADVFVAPSLIEPFGRVILEAMACKVPVIGTNVGGIPDNVKDRNTGLLVPPADSETLALKIQELLENTKFSEQLAENAYEYVHQNLDWKVIAKRTREEVYTKIIN